MAHYKHLKHLAAAGLILSTTVGCSRFAKDIPDTNPMYKEEKVQTDLTYYGGDDRYVATSIYDRPLPQPYYSSPFNNSKKNESVNHFDTGHNNNIKIGYSLNIDSNMTQQFNYVVDYLNEVFKVINPEYHFVTDIAHTAQDCDIFVTNKKINMDTVSETDEYNVGAATYLNHNKNTPTIIESARIEFNSKLEFSTPQLRYYMLHEMLHILYGSRDVNWKYSQTFSVYNYDDVYYTVSQICQAYESLEDYKNGTINNIGGKFVDDYNMKDKNGNIIETKKSLPIMSLQEKNSFVSLFPTDVSTLISIYGDSSKIENQKAYINLLYKTLETNKKLFDINPAKYGEENTEETISLPYYKPDFKLPENIYE